VPDDIDRSGSFLLDQGGDEVGLQVVAEPTRLRPSSCLAEADKVRRNDPALVLEARCDPLPLCT